MLSRSRVRLDLHFRLAPQHLPQPPDGIVFGLRLVRDVQTGKELVQLQFRQLLLEPLQRLLDPLDVHRPLIDFSEQRLHGGHRFHDPLRVGPSTSALTLISLRAPGNKKAYWDQ